MSGIFIIIDSYSNYTPIPALLKTNPIQKVSAAIPKLITAISINLFLNERSFVTET